MKNQHQVSYEEVASPNCCLMDIFSQAQPRLSEFQRNNSGLLNSNMEKIHSSSTKAHNSEFLTLNKQDSNIKRSISAANLKKRIGGKTLYQTCSIKQGSRLQRYPNKIIHTSMDAQKIQRFMSPSANRTSQYKNPEYRAQNHVMQRKELNFNQRHKTDYSNYSNQYFRQEKNYQKLSFQKKHYQKGHFNSFVPQNQQQISKQQQFQKSKQKISYLREQYGQLSNRKQYIVESKLSSPRLQIALTQKESDKKSFLRPFQYIQSYIVDVKPQKKQRASEQQQYDSIKTKGKAVQSFLFVSKDLRKTKKTKRKSFNDSQKKFTDLENITVTSEYQQQLQDSYKKQRIQESAIMVNFFHPPTHIKDQMDLSQSKPYGFN